jgi:ankyrin repeat protein
VHQRLNLYSLRSNFVSNTTLPSQEIIDQYVGNAHGNFSLVKEFLEKYPSLINANASWDETAIGAAAQTGQVEIVNYLLEHGAEYDICTAAMLGNLNCIQDYLREDANFIHATGAHGLPLLYFPVIHARLEVVDYLLHRGADVNAASPMGITPLHSAVMFNQPNMARSLLDHGADPDREYDGKTPLAMAVETKQDELIDILRSYIVSE